MCKVYFTRVTKDSIHEIKTHKTRRLYAQGVSNFSGFHAVTHFVLSRFCSEVRNSLLSLGLLKVPVSTANLRHGYVDTSPDFEPFVKECVSISTRTL